MKIKLKIQLKCDVIYMNKTCKIILLLFVDTNNYEKYVFWKITNYIYDCRYT